MTGVLLRQSTCLRGQYFEVWTHCTYFLAELCLYAQFAVIKFGSCWLLAIECSCMQCNKNHATCMQLQCTSKNVRTPCSKYIQRQKHIYLQDCLNSSEVLVSGGFLDNPSPPRCLSLHSTRIPSAFSLLVDSHGRLLASVLTS